jgi:hypothetical protein
MKRRPLFVVAEKTDGRDPLFPASVFRPDILSKLEVPKACAILIAAAAFSQITRV